MGVGDGIGVWVGVGLGVLVGPEVGLGVGDVVGVLVTSGGGSERELVVVRGVVVLVGPG